MKYRVSYVIEAPALYVAAALAMRPDDEVADHMKSITQFEVEELDEQV